MLVAGCTSPEAYRDEADLQSYAILQQTAAQVTGTKTVWPLERPSDTVRQRLLQGSLRGGQTLVLDLLAALDVAAENSRDFQRQKELMYQTALALTAQRHQFEFRYTGGSADGLAGVGDDEQNLSLQDHLSTSMNTDTGGKIVASFVNTFLKSIVHGGTFDGSSILSLTLTQPLLRAAGRRIALEPLTQAERNVVYQVRDFERFRRTFAVRVTTEYYGVVQQVDNLKDVLENYNSLERSRLQMDEMAKAGRATAVDVGRARQNELTAEDRYVTAQARLQSSLDRFKLTLGLPTQASIRLDQVELERLRALGVQDVPLTADAAGALASDRRLDLRNTFDEVDDAARGILVASDALESVLDWSAAISVPTDRRQPFAFDFSKINWSTGFDLELALDRLPERNAYRTALINLDVAIRAREQLQDTVQQEVRDELRNMHNDFQTYLIQSNAVALAQRRVEATNDLFDAGRVATFEVLDAKADLLAAQLSLTAAIVDYAVARLDLLRDLEALALEPKGLRYDPALLLPAPATAAGEKP